jgi:type IV pilus secretin PilQ/predicted competence protein
MAGMKTRLNPIRIFASSKVKGAIHQILLLLLLALAAPGFNRAEDKLNRPPTAQESGLASISEVVVSDSALNEVSEEPADKAIPSGSITDIEIAPADDSVTITATTDRLLAPGEFILDNPPRLVVDLPNTINRIKTFRFPVNAASVKQVKVAQFQTSPSPIARMVFELEKDYGTHEIAANQSSISLVFHKEHSESDALVSGPAADPETVSVAMVQEKPDLKAVVPASESIPLQTKPAEIALPAAADHAVKTPPMTATLVSALTPSALAPPALLASGSRFSGQPLTLDFVDTPLVDFFRLLAEEGGVNIVLDPAVKGTISMKVVKLPWDQIFEAALVNNGLDKQVEGSLIRVAKKATLQEEARQKESLNRANMLAADLETRVKRLNYAKAATLVDIIADQKTVRGTVVVDERTNALVLTDLPDSIDKQIQLIDRLDVPQQQVEIEARIVSGTRDFARDIGVQFGFVNGNLQRVTVGGPNTSGTIGGTRPSNTPSNTYAAGNPLSGRGSSQDTVSSSGAVSTGGAGNYNVNLPAARAFGGLGISIGNIFDTFLLDAAITAGESKGWAKLISQPRVTAQNNTPAVVTQGLRFPVPINANNTVTIQFFNAALTLTTTPQITHEGNILLDLKVENNTPDFGNMVMGVPSIRTTESSTRVLVSDGGTTLISGIMIENESEAEEKVPGLGSLPVVGNLFRRSSVARNTQEVLFFITPRIIK